MEETKENKGKIYRIIAAVALIINALAAFCGLVNYIIYIIRNFQRIDAYTIINIATVIIVYLIATAGNIVAAVGLLKGGKNTFLVGFILAILANIYFLYDYMRYVYGMFGILMWLISHIGLLVLVLFCVFTESDEKITVAKKIWWLPGAIMALYCVLSLFPVCYEIGIFPHINGLFGLIDKGTLGIILTSIVDVVGFLFLAKAATDTGYWAVKIRDEERDENGVKYCNGYIGMASHVLLMLFTFGIYTLCWTYKVTKYLNCVKNEPYRNPTTKLLLCMFVPFYQIYWIYKSAQLIDKLASYSGVQGGISTSCLVLAIFIGIVPPIIMQEKINSIELSSKNRES